MLTARRLGLGLIGGLLPLLAACGGGDSPAATPTIEATPAAQTTLATPTTAAQSQAKTQTTAAPTTPAATATVVATQPPAASPTQAASPTAATQALSAQTGGSSGDAEQSVLQSYVALGRTQNFRMAGAIREDGTTEEILAEFSSPERVRLVTSEGEVRIVDDVMYSKGPDGQWLGIRGMSAEQQTGNLFQADEAQQELNAATDFRRIGTETIDGVPTTIYEYTRSQNGQQERTKVWVGDNEGHIRKVETQENGSVATFVFSDYGQVPEVTAPEGAQILDVDQPGQNLPIQPPTGIPGGN